MPLRGRWRKYDRYPLHTRACRLLRPVCPLHDRMRKDLNMLDAIVGVVGVLLIGYLIVVVLRPEWF
jgi:K+-transporting ATPase KdpF subunit